MPRRSLLVLAACLSGTAFAADSGTNPGTTPPGGAPMDPAMMALMQPGPEHQTLAKMVGSWDVDGKMWMDPKAPPTESKGTAQFTSLFDGRFIRQDYQGTMMGMPFTGIGYDGFDRGRKVYTSVWMDSMGTATMTMDGKASADGKTITYDGDMYCPQVGGVAHMRSVCTQVSDSEFTFEMFMVKADKPEKGMELHYHRKMGAK